MPKQQPTVPKLALEKTKTYEQRQAQRQNQSKQSNNAAQQNSDSQGTAVEEEIKEAEVEENKAEEPRLETATAANEVEQQINQMVIQHEPGKLDLAFEQALEAPKAIDNIQ